MYTCTLLGPEKQPLLREFFYEDDIQLQIQVPRPHENLFLFFIYISMNVVNHPGTKMYHQIPNLWYNSSHLDLLFLMATVSHLIRDASSSPVIFFRFMKIPKRLSSCDNSAPSRSQISEAEEDHRAWRGTLDEMRYTAAIKSSKSRWPELYHKCAISFSPVSEQHSTKLDLLLRMDMTS